MKLLILFILFLNKLSAQDHVNHWGTLSMVTINKTIDPEFGIESYETTFNPIVRALDNTELTLEGYIIPITGQVAQNHFMFSKFPQNMCFFCGKAGPESAMQVFMKDDNTVNFTTDKIRLKGTLKIFQDNSSGLIYALESAELIE